MVSGPALIVTFGMLQYADPDAFAGSPSGSTTTPG